MTAPGEAVERALDRWRIPSPRQVVPASRGVNNLSSFVHSPDGSYFLRVYQNTSERGRILYEHEVLLRLQGAGLPFEVPRPLRADSGETFVWVGGAVAALFPVIPGDHPDPERIEHVEACAGALAELDRALVTIRPDPDLPVLTTYGDLYRVHPRVPDPLEMAWTLPVPEDERDRVGSLIRAALARVPEMYERLPGQIIHSDFAMSNVLMLGDSVTGVLDFEFASPDLRALDFAVGLSMVALPDRERIEAFSRGYLRHLRLTRDEIEALPDMLRLRFLAALIHRVGRFLAGLSPQKHVQDHVEALIETDDWLSRNASALVRCVVRHIQD